MITQYSHKLIQTKNEIEFITYEKPIRLAQGQSKKRTSSQSDNKLSRSRGRWSSSRAITSIRRLISGNDDLQKFLTLTFRDDPKSISSANYQFNQFVKRLRRRYPQVKYLAVIELTKRGRVHYHVMINLPFVNFDKLTQLWGNGFIFVNKIYKKQFVALYLTKYLQKEIQNEALFGKKAYFTSQNLIQPVITLAWKAIFKFNEIRNQFTQIFEREFNNEYRGRCHYRSYILTTHLNAV